jgi:hypothetical protein
MAKKLKSLLILSLLTALLVFSTRPVEAAASVTLMPNHSGRINDDGNYAVVGEISNTGDTSLQNILVNATFYDSNGTYVAEISGVPKLDFLLPGRKAPFEIVLANPFESLKVHNYTLEVTAYQPSSDRIQGLEILSHSWNVTLNVFRIAGQIKNIGLDGTTFTRVIATFYNASNYVIATRQNASNPSTLGSGQTVPFDISLNSTIAQSISYYALTAESFDYELIPEFRPIIILSTLLMVTATVALTKTRSKKPETQKT